MDSLASTDLVRRECQFAATDEYIQLPGPATTAFLRSQRQLRADDRPRTQQDRPTSESIQREQEAGFEPHWSYLDLGGDAGKGYEPELCDALYGLPASEEAPS